jgi:glycosyltransferase involved in cell wall biosynthesis
MHIGVAIPCYKYHILALIRCLDSIEAQTVKPDQVVVSCSSSKLDDLPEFKYSFPLRVITTEEKKNAAQNRNIAASHLDTEIVSFFDADDEMHPQRLEAIRDAFLSYRPCDIVLHSFWEGEENNRDYMRYTTFDKRYDTLRRAPTGCAIHAPDWSARLHHAQASVSKFICSRVQFKEDPGSERREDALFCGDVLAMPNVRSVYITNPLSKYYMEGVTH